MTLQIQITPYEYALACVGQCLRSHRPAPAQNSAPEPPDAPAAPTAPAPAPAPPTPAAELDLTC